MCPGLVLVSSTTVRASVAGPVAMQSRDPTERSDFRSSFATPHSAEGAMNNTARFVSDSTWRDLWIGFD
jgi:hypothetical protein